MSEQQPNPLKVITPGSPPSGILETLLIDQLGSVVNRLPPQWKTLSGLVLLVTAWVSRAFLAPYCPEQPWISPTSEWMEYAALALFGIGVYHKALLADPKRVA